VRFLLAVALIASGFCFSLYPWLNSGGELGKVACLLPLGLLLAVVVAASVPVRISVARRADDFDRHRLEASDQIGFSRFQAKKKDASSRMRPFL